MEDKKVIFSETAKVFREERTLHYKEKDGLRGFGFANKFNIVMQADRIHGEKMTEERKAYLDKILEKRRRKKEKILNELYIKAQEKQTLEHTIENLESWNFDGEKQEKVKEAVTKLHEINLQLSDEVEELEKTLLGKEPDMPEETDGDEE